MKFLKKYYKLIGTLITVVAFVFVIKKIVTMDVDWSMFASGKPLGIIAGCVLVQTAIIFFMSTPWVQFVRILSGKKIAMKDALPVYTKCNLMKYVPGNVFQYVGRNQLAADLHISHVDVACATVLEILCSLVAPLVWILLLMGKDMVGLIRTYEKNFLLVLGIGVREAVMVLTCSTFLDTNTIMLYAVTMRIISTFGDVLAFFLGWLLHLIWKLQKATA